VLDNFEQVASAAQEVSGLLAASTRLKVLVTSRAPLHIRAEHELFVPPLEVPASSVRPSLAGLSDYPAIALFIDRARAIRSDFELNDENAVAVAEICVRLDGLPLAIELAAARTRLLSPQAMLVRMNRLLPLLTGGARDLPARQQTLRGAIAWSYDLLDEMEKCLFRRLAIFVGGCSFEAIEAIIDVQFSFDTGILDAMTSLIAKNLVTRGTAAVSGDRFAMLSTIREFAWEQLEASGELEVLSRRHASYFLALAEEAGPMLRSADQLAWIERLQADHENLRAALAWSQSPVGDISLGLRIAGALGWYWVLCSHVGEGQTIVGALLSASASLPTSAARALVLDSASLLHVWGGEYEATARFADESARAYREIGDDAGLGRALTAMLTTASSEGDPARLLRLYQEAMPLVCASGDRWYEAFLTSQLGAHAWLTGDHDAAWTLRREAVSYFKQIGDRWGIGLSTTLLAMIARLSGDYEQSATLYRAAILPLRELREGWIMSRALDGMAAVSAARDRHVVAAQLLGAAESLRDSVGTPIIAALRPDHARIVAEVEAALGSDALSAAWAEGRTLSYEEAVALALAQSPLN
jgi:non-specific serine/threonine protein kinase